VQEGINGFVAAFRRDGSVLWLRGISGWSEVTAVTTWHGFCADAQGHHQTIAPTIYLKSPTGLGAQNVRRCSFVTAVGNTGQNNQRPDPDDAIDVGVTRQPRTCSQHLRIGATNSTAGDLPCSGILRPQGMGGDVFVVKWDLATGLPEYAKLLGSRDSHETVAHCAATEDGGVLLAMSMVSPFSVFRGTGYDTLGLARSGRPNAPGCPLETAQLQHISQTLALELQARGFQVKVAQPGAPQAMPANLRAAGSAACIQTPHAPFYESGMIAKVVDGLRPQTLSAAEQLAQTSSGIPATPQWLLAEHGRYDLWDRAANCSRASVDDPWAENGCNSDGVVWARMMGTGRSFFSSQQSRAARIAPLPGHEGPGLVVGGEIRGFVEAIGGFQPDDLSPDINGGLINADVRDVAATVIALLE